MEKELGYSQKTHDLILRMEKCNLSPYVWNEEKVIELMKRSYEFFGLDFPKKISFHKDPFDNIFASTASTASTAWTAWAASTARTAWKASTVSTVSTATPSYDWDWFVITYEYSQANKVNNENDKKYIQYHALMLEAQENGMGYFVEWEDTLYIAQKPVVRVNPAGQLHSEHFPAIEWQSEEKSYYLNGVNFPKEMWQKLINHEMSFQEILAIRDIDQRTQAMRYGDVNEFLKHAKAKLLDSYEKQTPQGKIVSYALYKIPKGEIFTEDAYYAVYDCSSTGRKYMSGVLREHRTVAEAMGWKHYLSPEIWKMMVPLIHES